MGGKEKMSRDGIFWNIPIPERLDKAVEKAVEEGYASTKSELVRFAVVSYLNFPREKKE